MAASTPSPLQRTSPHRHRQTLAHCTPALPLKLLTLNDGLQLAAGSSPRSRPASPNCNPTPIGDPIPHDLSLRERPTTPKAPVRRWAAWQRAAIGLGQPRSTGGGPDHGQITCPRRSTCAPCACIATRRCLRAWRMRGGAVWRAQPPFHYMIMLQSVTCMGICVRDGSVHDSPSLNQVQGRLSDSIAVESVAQRHGVAAVGSCSPPLPPLG